MARIKQITLLLLLALLFGLAQPIMAETTSTGQNATSANSSLDLSLSANNDAFRAVVKIETYVLDASYNVQKIRSGSGIIINSSGIVLTNYHVISAVDAFDDSDLDRGYLVCLPLDLDKPACDYTAKLIAVNKDLDVALLQLVGISGLGVVQQFPYLEMQNIDSTNINDQITAIGYPAVGGRTITVTKGVISGKTVENDKKWLKTDAAISFGSSGGAAIDANNKVIGITSAISSDFPSSMGYIINMELIVPWVNAHLGDRATEQNLTGQVTDLVMQQVDVNTSDVFTNTHDPKYRITKPSDWKFTYYGGNELSLENPDDADGGYISISVDNLSYPTDINSILPRVKYLKLLKGQLQNTKIKTDQNVKVGGMPAKKLYVTDSNGFTRYYAVPFGASLIYLDYSYGKNDKDKQIVEKAIQSLVKTNNSAVNGKKEYQNYDPNFNIKMGKDWYIYQNNLTSNPLEINNSKYKDVFVNVKVSKITDDEEKAMSNKELLTEVTDYLKKINRYTGLVDFKTEVLNSNSQFKLTKKIKNAIKVSLAYETNEGKKTIAYETDYLVRIGGDYSVSIQLYAINGNKNTAAKYQVELEKMLQNFTIE